MSDDDRATNVIRAVCKGEGTLENMPKDGSPRRECLNRYLGDPPTHPYWIAHFLNRDGIKPPTGSRKRGWTQQQVRLVAERWGHLNVADVPGAEKYVVEYDDARSPTKRTRALAGENNDPSVPQESVPPFVDDMPMPDELPSRFYSRV